MEKELSEFILQIKGQDSAAMARAREHQEKLAKPPGSLGKLEDIAVKLSGISGEIYNELSKRRIIVLCADNGIIEEGVSCTPRSVTAAQAVNMTKAKTGMSSMAKSFGDEIQVVDVGIADPYDAAEVLNFNIREGTNNFYIEDAMSRDECIKAILIGTRLAAMAKQDGVSVVGVGEMGIGNTSTSSAVLSVLTGLSIESVTGRGGGLTDDAFKHKKEILEEAIKRRNPNKDDVIDVISKVGGLDIAAMCGVFLGCAHERIPVVIDGFISVVAALCAQRLCSKAKDFMFPSHESFEPGYMKAIKELNLEPYFNMGMRLGEGSGCVLSFELMAAACAMTNKMALFNEDSNIDDSYLKEIREGDKFSV